MPVIASGDVTSRERAQELLDETGCAAVMVGRAAQGNPWAVGEIAGAARRRAGAGGGRRRARPLHARDRGRARRAARDRLPEEVLRLVPRPRPLPEAVQAGAGAARRPSRRWRSGSSRRLPAPPRSSPASRASSRPRRTSSSTCRSPSTAADRDHRHAAITPAMAVATGERRIVSVLVADVVGSTAIAEKLGPERSKFLIDEVMRIMTEQVRRFDGTVAQLVGDEMLALLRRPRLARGRRRARPPRRARHPARARAVRAGGRGGLRRPARGPHRRQHGARSSSASRATARTATTPSTPSATP